MKTYHILKAWLDEQPMTVPAKDQAQVVLASEARAEVESLREKYRPHVLVTRFQPGEFSECLACKGSWPVGQPESHAPDCAARLT